MKAPKTRLRLDLTNDYVKNREIKTDQKVDNLIKATNPKQQQTIRDFQNYLKNLGKAPNTVAGYCFSVKRILDKYNGKIGDYTSKDWIKFFENRPENWNGDNNRASQIGQVAMERLLEMVHGLSNKGKVFDILYSKYPKVKINTGSTKEKSFLIMMI